LLFSWVLSLREGVVITTEADGGLILSRGESRFRLRHLTLAIRNALERLADPGEAERDLMEAIRASEGQGALARWYFVLQQLARRGWLLISACTEQKPLATLVPISPWFIFTSSRRIPDRPHVLSRFAFMRSDGGVMVLESPLAFSRVILHDERATALIHLLTLPKSPGELANRVAQLEGSTAAQLLGLFVTSGMVTEVGDDGATDEYKNPALKCWEFHDLLFHTRSRVGRHDAPFGGTYQHAGELEPPPALKPSAASETIDLYRPDLEQLKRDDQPFAELQERRCSIREYGDTPITARQLGEFLFRVARVKDRRQWDVITSHGLIPMTGTTRPYPAGGGLYELEVYVVVHNCADLDTGLYHYDPLAHQLAHLAGRTSEVEALLSDASRAAGLSAAGLQVLLVLASRMPRLAWKYSSLAYSLTLKHVGVMYQTMYLAATAMGLAPCGLGGGDSDLFARASGVDYYAETSVGEFLLGSKR
jgi:oxazoline/thiazoline dehydrogenase